MPVPLPKDASESTLGASSSGKHHPSTHPRPTPPGAESSKQTHESSESTQPTERDSESFKPTRGSPGSTQSEHEGSSTSRQEQGGQAGSAPERPESSQPRHEGLVDAKATEEAVEEEVKEEDKEECGWCRWMKAGGCQEPFMAWQKCVDEMADTGREVTECANWMGPLFECMVAHKEYYQPQLNVFLETGEEDAGDVEAGTDKS